MTRAYAAVATGNLALEPYTVRSIQGATQQALFTRPGAAPRTEGLVGSRAAMLDLLQAVVRDARAAPLPCCLIVEDQVLIGLSLEAYLEEFGYQVAGPLTTAASALAWLESRTPDFAILDYVLPDGSCLELARELQRRSVPFLIYSGRSRPAETPAEFLNVPWLEKPTARDQLLRAVETVRASKT